MGPRFAVLVLLAVSTAIYIGNASRPALLDDADAEHALVSREMLQRGDWVVMYLNGIRYLMKAPLHYWIVAVSYLALGQNEFATRLPVALAVVGLSLLIYVFGRRFFGARAGLYSGLAMCTCVGVFLFTRIMIPEAIYALEFTAIFYLFLRGWTGTLPPRAAYWSAAALTGLAMLTRGLVGVIFPVAILGLFVLLTRDWHRWRELRLFSSSAIFLAIAAPWHVLAELRAPGFFWSYFINEHVKRALGTRYPADYEATPLFIWLAAHLVWLFPWSVFLPAVRAKLPHPREWNHLPVAAQARLLLFLWAGFILLFFSLTFGSRLEYYAFGAWPALALLLGTSLAEAEEENRRWVGVAQAGLAVAGVIVAGVLGAMLWISAGVRVSGDISSFLQPQSDDSYRLAMGHLFDLTPRAFAVLRVPSALAGCAVLIGFPAAWWLRRRRRPLGATLVTGVTMAVFFFAANIAYGIFGPYMSSRTLVASVAPFLRPEDPVVLYGKIEAGSSIAYYAHRRLLLWNGRYNNTLEPGSYYPDAPAIFLTDADFPGLWRSEQRVFLFVPAERSEAALKRLPRETTYLLATSGGKAVYVNHRIQPELKSLEESDPAATSSFFRFVQPGDDMKR